MKGMGKFFAVALCALALVATEADAARVGGGKSVGRQSGNVSQSQAMPNSSPAQPGTPMQQAQPSAARPTPAAQPQPSRSRWLAPLAGIAAGLGLAALASHFGFGEELASIMLMVLVAFAVLFVVRMVMARRAQPRPAFQSGYGQAGIGQEAAVRFEPLPASVTPGSVASPATGAAAQSFGAAAAPSATWRVPADFDAEGFVRNAKVQFIRLQAAFDAGDLNDLREFTSPEMFAELKMQVAERGGKGNRTDVVRLDAELLGIESGSADHLASVRFHGLIREADGAPAEPFDEVWNLEKPVSGSAGWVLSGIQQLG